MPTSPKKSKTSGGDEILVWSVIAPGDVIEGVGGPLFNPAVTYQVVLVPGDQEQHYLNAIQKGIIGKADNGEDRTHLVVHLRDVLPLHTYHLGYKEGPFWHWTTITVPLRLRPMACTDRTVSVHLDFSHDEDVVAVRTLVTSSLSASGHGGGFRKEREYIIDDLPVDETSELQYIAFRNLLPCCAYFIEAWPIFSDGTEGGCALTTRIVTQAEVMLLFQEIGDTYLRIGFRRPPLRQPLHPGVVEDDAVVEEYSLCVWEDPSASLLKNATRLSRGRQPQRYPLRKAEYTGTRLPCGVTQVVVVDNLKPNTAHFVTLHTRAPIAEHWDPRMVRVRVKTCAELRLPIEPPQLTATTLRFAWARDAPLALPFCDADVPFPEKVNLFDDREVTNPYIGANVVELPDGQVWSVPTILGSNQGSDGALTTMPKTADDGAGSTTTLSVPSPTAFEVSVTDVAQSTTRIHVVRNASCVTLRELCPSTTYVIKVRTVPIAITRTRGDVATPWSRPYVIMTPSDVLFRPLHRSHNDITVAWGRLMPSTMMPLDFEPGRYKYLPDANDATPNAPFYYYLEPLPFLCGEEIDHADLSESEDEEEVYADGCVTGNGVGYLGKRSRILNRQARPTPVPFPCDIDREEYTLVSLVVFGHMSSDVQQQQQQSVEQDDQAGGNGNAVHHPLGVEESASPPPSAPSKNATEGSPPSALVDTSSTSTIINDAVIKRWQKNLYRDQGATVSEEARHGVLPNGMTALSCVTNAPATGVQRFDNLLAGSPVRIFCFSQSRGESPCLSCILDVFTLPSDAALSSRRPFQTVRGDDGAKGGIFISMPQLMWSKHLCNTALRVDRTPFLELKEVSEVFVTLRIGLRHASECASSLHLALLDNNALEWSDGWRSNGEEEEEGGACETSSQEDTDTTTSISCSDEGSEGDDDEEREEADDVESSPHRAVHHGTGTSHVEYLIAVEQVEVIDGVRTVVGKRREVYYCTKKPVVQLVDLTAASRFDVSVATVCTKQRVGWTPFSEPITFTTVQKLLFEMEEISTEYINLKWGRSRLDRIRDYSIQITELSADAGAAPSPSEASNGSHNETMVIQTTGTRYRLDTQRQLRPNALFDCMVVPHYTNGQRGLDSNVLRFLQCSLRGTIVEAGVAHLRLEWTPPPLHDLIPNCPNASHTDESSAASIVSVCLIRLRDASRTWERTVQCNPATGVHTFEGLGPQTQYDAHIALIALLPRCSCCMPPQPKQVLPCCEPFTLSGVTLGQPSARISRVWENALEVEYFFESEPMHEGLVSLELCLIDRKHAEDTHIALNAVAQGKHGRGTYIAQGLNPGRSYSAQLRQQYSRGTWGEWRNVLDGIRTLPKLSMSLQSITETTFEVRAAREPFTCSTIAGMEDATQEHPQRFRFRVELLGQKQKSMSSSSLGATALLEASRSARGTPVPVAKPKRAALENVGSQEDADDALKEEGTTQNDEETQAPLLQLDAPPVVVPGEGSPDDEDEEDEWCSVRFIETTSDTSILPGLEPNTPYRIVVQQWSLDDWGAESPPIHSYTLNQMVLNIARRCDSYFEVHCTRDKRLPIISTTVCRPHSDSSTIEYSKLIGVTLTATSLVTNIMTTRFFVPCTEATCPSVVGRIVDLESSHPYRVDVRTEYEGKETCPIFTSLATITASVPVMNVAALGEDFVSIVIDKKSIPSSFSQAQDAFHALPSSVRHAAAEGQVVDIVEYHFKFIPIHFDEDDDVKRAQLFQNPASQEESVSVLSTAAAVTKTGLMSEVPYNIFVHTVDESEFSGKRHLIGAICTRAFPRIFVNKLSENFAEIEWREDEQEIGEDRTVATVSGAISKRFGRWLRVAPCEGYNLNDNCNNGDMFEFVIAEDIVVPDVNRPATRTAVIPYQELCSLVEQLNPETQYFVIGRCRRRFVNVDGTFGTFASAWGSPTRFATLALLVLRVVHCSLDFANVAWQDPVSTSPVERASHTHGAGNLEDDLWGSTTSFTKRFVDIAAEEGQGPGALSGGSAQAVRFQLRLMHATAEGECGGVIQDMYVVTADGIHTIEHLIPGKAYAVSMRVCYVGLSGSWVAPAVFRSDKFPEPRYVSLTRRDVEMELELETGGELREAEELQVPDRNHRLYEVSLTDSDYVRYLLVKVHEPTRLFIAGLSRGRRYRVAIREIINGVRYGAFVHLCSFWMQPYPPMIVRLLECRDGCCEMEWRVIERKTQAQRDEEEDVDYVYQLEQGIRSPDNPAEGTQWREVVITDTIKHRFKWTERLPNGPSDAIPFSQLCFRVRCSKCFVQQKGLAYKSPVWGDWSLIAYWNNATPPHSITHLTIAYASDSFAIAKWDLPHQWEVHPGLRYIVKIRVQEPAVGTTSSVDKGGHHPLVAPPTEIFEWHTVGTTLLCAVELPNLAKATTYVVAVQSESTFGVNPQLVAVSFTTRYVPNDDPKPALHTVAPKPLIPQQRLRALLLPGMRPVDPYESSTTNLYDKYEEPKRLRLRAVVRLAGMLDRTKRGEMLKMRFQCLIRRLITTQKIVHRYAADLMMQPNFKPNEVLTPEQVARLRFGLDPDDGVNVWTREFEAFLETEEHTALRRTFTVHQNALSAPGSLVQYKRKKSMLTRKVSAILDRRRSHASTPTLKRSVSSMCQGEEGVSWTADAQPQRASTSMGMRSRSVTMTTPVEKPLTRSTAEKQEPRHTAPKLSVCSQPSSLPITPTSSPNSAQPPKEEVNEDHQYAAAPRLSKADGHSKASSHSKRTGSSAKTIVVPKSSTNDSRLPSIQVGSRGAGASPIAPLPVSNITPKITAAESSSSSSPPLPISLPPRVTVPDDARSDTQCSSSNVAVDPVPTLPMLMRNRLLASLRMQSN